MQRGDYRILMRAAEGQVVAGVFDLRQRGGDSAAAVRLEGLRVDPVVVAEAPDISKLGLSVDSFVPRPTDDRTLWRT